MITALIQHETWGCHFFLGSHAVKHAFPRIYCSRKDVHIFMKCTNREYHTCRQGWIYSCLLKLAASRPHSRVSGLGRVDWTFDKLYPVHQAPQTPIWLTLSVSFQHWRGRSVLGRGVLCTHTLTLCGRQKRGCNRVDGCWIIFISMEFCSASYCVCCMFLCVRERYQQPFLARGLFAQWFMTKVTVASPHNALLPSSQATGGSPLPFSLSWEIPNEFLWPEIWQNLRLLW